MRERVQTLRAWTDWQSWHTAPWGPPIGTTIQSRLSGCVIVSALRRGGQRCPVLPLLAVARARRS
jgi:hypothetical protein